MRTVNIPTQAKTITSLLKKAKKEGLILRSPEGQEFILAEIDDFNREIELTRQNKALMKLLDASGKQNKTFTTAEARKTARSRLNPRSRSADRHGLEITGNGDGQENRERC